MKTYDFYLHLAELDHISSSQTHFYVTEFFFYYAYHVVTIQ